MKSNSLQTRNKRRFEMYETICLPVVVGGVVPLVVVPVLGVVPVPGKNPINVHSRLVVQLVSTRTFRMHVCLELTRKHDQQTERKFTYLLLLV